MGFHKRPLLDILTRGTSRCGFLDSPAATETISVPT